MSTRPALASRLGLVVCGIILLAGCGSDPDHIASPLHHTAVVCVDEDGDGLGENCSEPDCDDEDPTVGACDVEQPNACSEGAERECKVVLGKHASVQSCWVGVQTCHEGAWGDCVAGTSS